MSRWTDAQMDRWTDFSLEKGGVKVTVLMQRCRSVQHLGACCVGMMGSSSRTWVLVGSLLLKALSGGTSY